MGGTHSQVPVIVRRDEYGVAFRVRAQVAVDGVVNVLHWDGLHDRFRLDSAVRGADLDPKRVVAEELALPVCRRGPT